MQERRPRDTSGAGGEKRGGDPNEAPPSVSFFPPRSYLGNQVNDKHTEREGPGERMVGITEERLHIRSEKTSEKRCEIHHFE